MGRLLWPVFKFDQPESGLSGFQGQARPGYRTGQAEPGQQENTDQENPDRKTLIML
jgi:hypothetical protein